MTKHYNKKTGKELDYISASNYRDNEKIKREQRVYAVSIDKTDNIDEMTDIQIMDEAELEGMVWSVEGFMDELNHDHLDTENYWFKII